MASIFLITSLAISAENEPLNEKEVHPYVYKSFTEKISKSEYLALQKEELPKKPRTKLSQKELSLAPIIPVGKRSSYKVLIGLAGMNSASKTLTADTNVPQIERRASGAGLLLTFGGEFYNASKNRSISVLVNGLIGPMDGVDAGLTAPGATNPSALPSAVVAYASADVRMFQQMSKNNILDFSIGAKVAGLATCFTGACQTANPNSVRSSFMTVTVPIGIRAKVFSRKSMSSMLGFDIGLGYARSRMKNNGREGSITKNSYVVNLSAWGEFRKSLGASKNAILRPFVDYYLIPYGKYSGDFTGIATGTLTEGERAARNFLVLGVSAGIEF